ncbi:BtpA/SgcQ family protein [Anaerolactibacter massiliensis]|uniref:BtpA/SgcQ family protein n=2 Tax=Erysipelotrichaceae TaxID=128827 RepID=UPI000CF9466F|nr:BtpA/SgcQ family protein [Anaerolactibacter massiliensis]
MSKLLEEHRKLFGTEKPVIGCLHMMALPGTPYYEKENTLEKQIERLNHDAEIFMKLGFDAVVFANEGDRPYLNTVGPEIVADYTRIATEVAKNLTIPYGCGVLIDPYASIAVAHAIGAKFIRTYVSNSYTGSFGPQAYCPGDIFRYRRQIDAEDVHVYTYFEAHGGTCLDTRTTEQQIEAGFGVMPISGMLIGGPHAGLPPEEGHFISIKKQFPDIPLILGSGSNKNNIRTLLHYSDGVIVGTSIKRDGYLYNEVDYDRAKEFIEAAKG